MTSKKVFKPLENVSSIPLDVINPISTGYDDKGISFKGYSRRLKGLNHYEKILQSRFSGNQTISSSTTPVSFLTLNDKTFYLKQVYFSGVNTVAIGMTTASSLQIGIRNAVGGVFEDVISLPTAKEGSSAGEVFYREFNFNPPIEIKGKDSSLQPMLSVKDTNGGNHIKILINGWYE